MTVMQRGGNGARRGGPARGYSWEPFEIGNEAALKHRAYATVALGPRADTIANELRPNVPGYASADEGAVRLLALGWRGWSARRPRSTPPSPARRALGGGPQYRPLSPRSYVKAGIRTLQKIAKSLSRSGCGPFSPAKVWEMKSPSCLHRAVLLDRAQLRTRGGGGSSISAGFWSGVPRPSLRRGRPSIAVEQAASTTCS